MPPEEEQFHVYKLRKQLAPLVFCAQADISRSSSKP